MDSDRVKGFTALVTHYLTIDLRPLLACHMSKMFKPPKQKGAHPPSGNPLMNLLMGAEPKKVITFLSTFLKRKNIVLVIGQ
jgi:hypothetical protein